VVSGGRKDREIGMPSPLILQPRDREMIVSTYQFGFLSRDQIQRLFGLGSVGRANIRLRKLFDHGYLSRQFLPTNGGSSKALYFLGPQGSP